MVSYTLHGHEHQPRMRFFLMLIYEPTPVFGCVFVVISPVLWALLVLPSLVLCAEGESIH